MIAILLLVACIRHEPTDTGGTADTGFQAPQLVDIPAGPFFMGCDEALDPACEGDERPGHTVTLSRYAIDRYEVTNHLWAECQAALRCSSPTSSAGADPDLPVVGVTFDQAEALCAWRGMRLPTEAEWEKAARGDTTFRLYPWGDAPPDCTLAEGRACGDGIVPVGSHPSGVSPYGVEDLAGNAWEWISDWYAVDTYETSPAEDPTGAVEEGKRVIRGVSLYASDASLRTGNREFAIGEMSCPLCGLRCVEDR